MADTAFLAQFKATLTVAATDEQNNVRLGQSPNGQAYIAWTGRGQHTIAAESAALISLRSLYIGPPELFLTSAFALLQRYATYRSLNPLEVRLPGPAVAYLKQIGVTGQALADPFEAGGLPYCSLFSDVDGLFSALQPYGKEGGGGELQLGSSCVILPPCEPTLAAAYARRALDGMQNRDGRTYWLVLPQACFRAHREISKHDLRTLDSRLQEGRPGVRAVQVLSSTFFSYPGPPGNTEAGVRSRAIVVVMGAPNGAVTAANVAEFVNFIRAGRKGAPPKPVPPPQGYAAVSSPRPVQPTQPVLLQQQQQQQQQPQPVMPPALQQPAMQPAYQPAFTQQPQQPQQQQQQQQQPIQPVQQPMQPQPQSILPGFGGLSGVGVGGVGPLGGFQAPVGGSASIQAPVGAAPGLGLGSTSGLGGVGLGGFGFGAPGPSPAVVGAGAPGSPSSRGFKGSRGFSLVGDDDADEGIDLNNLSLSLGGLGLGLGGDGEVDIDALATGSGSTPWK